MEQKVIEMLFRYVGILSAYAIGLVIWTWWWSDCQDCPKVSRNSQRQNRENLSCSECLSSLSPVISSRPYSPTRLWWSRPRSRDPSGLGGPAWLCWRRCVDEAILCCYPATPGTLCPTSLSRTTTSELISVLLSRSHIIKQQLSTQHRVQMAWNSLSKY